VPEPVPRQAGEALVELKAAALNHRDVWIKLGQYAGLKYPVHPGFRRRPGSS
jgi:zinc-binding alcohol dehydrogenase/oxidoreductase